MDFSKALSKMQDGEQVKLPEWGGFWYWSNNDETVIIHNKDGSQLDIRDTTAVDFTLRNICRDDWTVAPEDFETLNDAAYWWDEINFKPGEPRVLRRGDNCERVKGLQIELNRIGANLTVDGDYGPGTERAVRSFQKRIGLVADGVFGDKTAGALEGHPFPESLLQKDIEWAANALQCEVAAIMGVSEVESRGRGFFGNGKPAILFERHWMRRRLKHYGVDYKPYLSEQPNIVSSRTGGYVGGEAEHERLERAKVIHLDSALESASWGAYQIMGFHWKALGYESVTHFVDEMHKGERQHLEAFVAFIKNDQRLLNAIRAKDWATFARIYNGPAYNKHNPPYDVRMANAYNTHLANV